MRYIKHSSDKKIAPRQVEYYIPVHSHIKYGALPIRSKRLGRALGKLIVWQAINSMKKVYNPKPL